MSSTGALPKAEFIQELAIRDPIAAYGVLKHVPRVPFFMNATAVFNTFSLSTSVVAPLDTTISARTWMHRINFSLSQPEQFSGNVFKTTHDAALYYHPGVNVRITVLSGPRYDFCPNFTPLENITNSFNEGDEWSANWVLFKQQSLRCEFQLSELPPAVSPNGPPYTIVLTFTGWQFLDPTIDDMSVDFAAAKLREAGFWIPVVS